MKLSFFISYSRLDEHIVYHYAGEIRKHLNVNTWMDKDDIPTGRDWWDGICEGILECDFFVIFLSPHSADSKYCIAELRYAHSLNKVILPLMIAKIEPLPIIIKKYRIHYYDLVNYKDSRDVLLSLSGDIFFHLQNPREIQDVPKPTDPDDFEDFSTNKDQHLLFNQAKLAMETNDFALAYDLFQKAASGNNRVIIRKASELLAGIQKQLDPYIRLAEAGTDLADIIYSLHGGIIDQTEAEEEYAKLLIEYSGLEYPPTLQDVISDDYQFAYKKIIDNNLTKVTSLDLSDLDLKYIPPEIFNLTHLVELNLSNNQLLELPKSLNRLTKLQLLNLNGNDLKELNDNISSMVHLRQLYVSGNQLQFVPNFIRSLNYLQLLDLSYNELDALPDSVKSLTQLESLDLSGNRFEDFPEEILQLQELRELYFGNNYLSEIPEEIVILKKLVILVLDENELYGLPTSIGKLPLLEQLYAMDNNWELEENTSILAALRKEARNLE